MTWDSIRAHFAFDANYNPDVHQCMSPLKHNFSQLTSLLLPTIQLGTNGACTFVAHPWSQQFCTLSALSQRPHLSWREDQSAIHEFTCERCWTVSCSPCLSPWCSQVPASKSLPTSNQLWQVLSRFMNTSIYGSPCADLTTITAPHLCSFNLPLRSLLRMSYRCEWIFCWPFSAF